MKVPGPILLVLLIGLAAMSWWLANRGRDSEAAPELLGLAQPGYYLPNAVLEQTDDTGRVNLRVAADRATQDPARAEVELERLAVDYAPQADSSWRVTAMRGSLADEGRLVRLAGDVRLSGPASETAAPTATAAVVHTEHLLLDTVTELATSGDPVRIELAAHAVTARGLRADLKRETLRLDAAVNGSFAR